MKFNEGQVKFIKDWIRLNKSILEHDPEKGKWSLMLHNQLLDALLKINEIQ